VTARRPGDTLLARLWAARPDLRETLRARGRDLPPEGRAALLQPLFLDGYAWKSTEDWIGGYGDLDLELSWKYLDADLRPGTEFTVQLLPSVTDNVFLHARILPAAAVDTPTGRFEVVRCLYLVDYGVGAHTDDSGVLSGYAQRMSYGTIDYAPGFGPVAAYERVLVPTAPAGAELPPGRRDLRLALSGLSIPATR
jgi:hypothetical protein